MYRKGQRRHLASPKVETDRRSCFMEAQQGECSFEYHTLIALLVNGLVYICGKSVVACDPPESIQAPEGSLAESTCMFAHQDANAHVVSRDLRPQLGWLNSSHACLLLPPRTTTWALQHSRAPLAHHHGFIDRTVDIKETTMIPCRPGQGNTVVARPPRSHTVDEPMADTNKAERMRGRIEVTMDRREKSMITAEYPRIIPPGIGPSRISCL